MSRKGRVAAPGFQRSCKDRWGRVAALSRHKAAPTGRCVNSGHPVRRNYRRKKGAPTKRPTSRVAHNEICQSSNAIASALHASIRAQSPFLIQLLSSIQVPPTHITLGSAM